MSQELVDSIQQSANQQRLEKERVKLALAAEKFTLVKVNGDEWPRALAKLEAAALEYAKVALELGALSQ